MRSAGIFPFLALAGAMALQAPSTAVDAQQIANREFGPSFTVDTSIAPVLGDFDGDGQEDAVLVATSTSPLGGELDFHYRAIDPYDAYFGFGDPKVTAQFSATNVGVTRYLLVVHNWRAPRLKFLVLNLPFEQLSLGRFTHKKKTLVSIHVVEPGGMTAELFWDGKKYRWEPMYLAK